MCCNKKDSILSRLRDYNANNHQVNTRCGRRKRRRKGALLIQRLLISERKEILLVGSYYSFIWYHPSACYLFSLSPWMLSFSPYRIVTQIMEYFSWRSVARIIRPRKTEKLFIVLDHLSFEDLRGCSSMMYSTNFILISF